MSSIAELAAASAASEDKRIKMWTLLWKPRLKVLIAALQGNAMKSAEEGKTWYGPVCLVVGRPILPIIPHSTPIDIALRDMQEALRNCNWPNMHVPFAWAQREGRTLIVKMLSDMIKELNLSYPIIDVPIKAYENPADFIGPDGINVSPFTMTLKQGSLYKVIQDGKNDKEADIFNRHCVNGFYVINLFWGQATKRLATKRKRDQEDDGDEGDEGDGVDAVQCEPAVKSE